MKRKHEIKAIKFMLKIDQLIQEVNIQLQEFQENNSNKARMIYTNQILMKQGKIIQQKQEFNTAIQRFGMYLFIKIYKIFKKNSANPKIQRLKCGCALICQFSQFL
jgi:hypothetical protein